MKRIVVIAGVLVLAGGIWVVNLLWTAGHFKTIQPHFSGTCETITEIVGAEDITIDADTGVAWISACDRRAVGKGGNSQGGIYRYDLRTPGSRPILAADMGSQDFQPHGISLYKGSHEGNVLYVINHADSRHAVEIFDVENGRLRHRKTVTGKALLSPNDIAGAGWEQFFVTNDHKNPPGLFQILENYLRLKISNVVFYDGSRFSEAAAGIGYANGIAVSLDGKTLYVCAVTEKALIVYDRDKETGSLTLRERMPLGTGVDNIEIDSSGNLWIGAHPQMLKFIAHAKDPANLSPSQVLRLTSDENGRMQAAEIYLNAGEEISGSSVCAVIGKRMLIGSVFEEKFLDCRLP